MNIHQPVFEGGESEARAFIKNVGRSPYVYILLRPCQTPFYVGKGTGGRAFEHVLEALRGHRTIEGNPFKCNVIRKIIEAGKTVRYRIDSLHKDGPSADEREKTLIQCIGRLHDGGPLTNLAAGGGQGAAPYSTEKRTSNLSGASKHEETRRLNAFFQSIERVKSVPIKAVSRYGTSVRRTTTMTKPQGFKPRSAGALVASAICHDIQLVEGANIPRQFIYDGIESIIENGACENITGLDIVRVTASCYPSDEVLVLGPQAPALIRQLIGDEKLRRLGARF
jgi:hypothetical protein